MKRKLKRCCENFEGQAWNSRRGEKRRRKKSIGVKPKEIKLHMPPIDGGLAMTYRETPRMIFFCLRKLPHTSSKYNEMIYSLTRNVITFLYVLKYQIAPFHA
jgi:hypothetical protein